MKFTQISPNELKFTYEGEKYLLREQSVGVYGLGRCVSLYQLNGIDKKYVKCIGWTESDNHGGPSNEVLLSGIVTLEDCKTESVKYLKKLMS
jgi:hypothetical protein